MSMDILAENPCVNSSVDPNDTSYNIDATPQELLLVCIGMPMSVESPGVLKMTV
jgi:hypothetical protein